MLDIVSETLRRALIRGLPGTTPETIGFDPPNDEWRQRVGVAGGPLINAYLFDLRENRRLRTNDTQRMVQGNSIVETPAPYRVDCHYLLSVWSPAAPGQMVEPTLEVEHRYLGAIIASLARADPLVMAEIFEGATPLETPPPLIEHPMPLTLLPVEGFGKLVEFWGTMGERAPTKPVVYLVITAPFFATAREAGPPVTTIATRYLQPGAMPGEVLYEIGGRVGNSAAPLPDGRPRPVADAWVELLNPGGLRLRLQRTGADGGFTFGRLPAGTYTARASAENIGTLVADLVIPSPTGEYYLTY